MGSFQMKDSNREAFEAWLFREYTNAKDFVIVYRPDENIYEHHPTQARWEAWQAAQAVQEWISVKDQLPTSDPYNREYWVYETLNNKVQHDYWVCPDPDLGQDFEPFFNNWSNDVTHWMPMVKYPKPPV